MRRASARRARLRPLLLAALMALAVISGAHVARAAASPQKGDSFSYSETVTVDNGEGSYLGYSDQTLVSGTESVDSVSGSNVSESYSYSLQFSSSLGSSSSTTMGGNYTWSSGSYTYLQGTDDQEGYSSPTYVWFAMDPNLPVGGTFFALNTQLTVLSKDWTLQLPTEGDRYVQTIEAQGTGKYQRDDSYGVFNASYTWTEFFDPATGYIVGYHYVEQDDGQYDGQAGSFTYQDALYVSSTSYPLLAGSPSSTGSTGVVSYPAVVLLVAVVLVLIVVLLYRARRRRRSSLPEHPYSRQTPPPSPPAPGEPGVGLGSRPPEQVVIREVAMVNCKYCGTLIPTTAEVCPHCGAPLR